MHYENEQLFLRKRNMLIDSIVGDAYSLGAHWIYDVGQIEKKFGEYKEPAEPLPDSYHKDKHVWDQTHYGDQALILLHFLQE